MTALDRARGWFLAPPPPPTSSGSAGWSTPPPPDGALPPASQPNAAPGRSQCRNTAPAARNANPSTSHVASAEGAVARGARVALPDDSSAAAPASSVDPLASGARAGAPRGSLAPAARVASPSDGTSVSGAALQGSRRGSKRRPRPASKSVDVGDGAGGGWQPPVAGEWIADEVRAVTVTSAAVLGRVGEVEPVAAALALALRRETRAKAAAVAVAGVVPPDVEGASSGAAARRLAARLEGHGLEALVRGRLAWVPLDLEDPHFATTARRVTLVAAPAVLAVTAARTDAVDEALNEQDLLVIVTDDPEGPLVRLAAAGLERVPIVTVRPLGRGPARALARAGIRPARSLRQLLTSAQEATR